jgi:hypothetical protein
VRPTSASSSFVGLGYITIGSRIGATGISARTRSRVDLGSGICFLGLAGLIAVEEVASR